jgi:hypothetical protein
MFSQRIEKSTRIKVGITYGPVSASIEEEAGHLRGFHDQLGRQLDEIEAERQATAATVVI